MKREQEPVTREQMERIIGRYSGTVYRLAFAQTRSHSDADDVYQEVFLRYVRKLPEFENEQHEKAWFLRVTVNCCKKLWASAYRRKSVPLEEGLSYEEPESSGLREELLKLPKKYGVVLHLHYWEGMTAVEIGKLLGLRPASVRSRLSRARNMLKLQMEGGNGDAGAGV